MRNLLLDPETDCLKIFGFSRAAKLGWVGDADHQGAYGYDEHSNDVKFAVFTLYEVITCDLSLRKQNDPRELDSSTVLEMQDWEKHPDVRLEGGSTSPSTGASLGIGSIPGSRLTRSCGTTDRRPSPLTGLHCLSFRLGATWGSHRGCDG